MAPGAWARWLDLLRADVAGAGQGSFDTVGWYLPIPLAPRLAVAAAIAALAAWTSRRWLLPVAVVLALPVVWLNGLAVLAACLPLWRLDHGPVERREDRPEMSSAEAVTAS